MSASEHATEQNERDTAAITADPTTSEIASYVRDLTHGMRQITQHVDQKEIRFLDYLLAILEGEARKIADHSYH